MKSIFTGLSPDSCFAISHLPINHDGYPIVGNGKGGKSKAYRFAYRIFCGDIPRGAMVLHECGRANCVNPFHLYLGDAAQNAADRDRHGKTARGARLPQTKLSEADVAAIRSSSQRVTDLARRYGVSVGCVSSIRAMRQRSQVRPVAQKVGG